MKSEITFTLLFEGQEIRVHYHPEYFSDYAHFEFCSPHVPARPIPISQTGYRSHFEPMQAVAAWPSVEICAHKILSAFMGPTDPDQFMLF